MEAISILIGLTVCAGYLIGIYFSQQKTNKLLQEILDKTNSGQ